MTNAQHTPGPWKLHKGQDYICIHHGSFDILPDTHWQTWDETDMANARLIAAAPELLNGCQALVGLIQLVLERTDLPDDLFHILKNSHRLAEGQAAIVKAKGAI